MVFRALFNVLYATLLGGLVIHSLKLSDLVLVILLINNMALFMYLNMLMVNIS